MREDPSPPASAADRGAVIQLVAVAIVVLVVAASLAVDIGRQGVAGRETRTVVDLAALDAAKVLDPTTPSGPQIPTVRAMAERSAARNGFVVSARSQLEVTLGHYDRTTDVFTAAPVSAPADAVRVRARRDQDNLFLPGSLGVSRTAIASGADGVAAVGIATSTAGVDTARAAVLDAVLGRALGGSVTLDAVTWRTLAATDLSLADVAVALGLGPDQVGELLDRTWSTAELVAAIATALAGTPAGSALAPIVGTGTAPLSVRLGDAISVDVAGDMDQVLAVSALDALWAAATATVAGGTVDVTLDLGVPGVAALPVRVAVVQPPQIAFGPVGTNARSAQLVATLAPSVTGVSLPPLASSALTVPLVVETGRGTATITSIPCRGGSEPGSVSVTADTAAAVVSIGTRGSGGSVAKGTLLQLDLLGLPVARVDALVSIPVASGRAGLTFAPAYSWGGAQHLSATGNPTSVLAVAPAQLDVVLLGALPLGVNVGGIASAVTSAVNPVLTGVVPPLLRALGVDLGAADVAVPAAQCRPAVLLR